MKIFICIIFFIKVKKIIFDQIEEFLDKIVLKSNGFEVLSEVLIVNGQEDIVNFYLKLLLEESEKLKRDEKIEFVILQEF